MGVPIPPMHRWQRIATFFLGCTGVAYGPPYLVVSWPRPQVKPWPLTIGGMPLYYATLERPHLPTFGRVGRAAPMMTAAEQWLKTWESPSNGLIKEIAIALVEKVLV
jgi:hypothetical protein